MVRVEDRSTSTSLWADEGREGELVLSFIGRLDSISTPVVWDEAVETLQESDAKRLVLDAEKVDYCDGSGVALFVELRRIQLARGGTFEITNLESRFKFIYDMFDPSEYADASQYKPKPEPMVEEVGRRAVGFFQDVRQLISFVGELAAALPGTVRNWRQVRWADVFHVMETAGVNALPIVMLVGFLMGLIMAFQSAVPMKKFGAEIFVADLIGISMLKELGPLLTAIVLAGRSGSAFAAEIGTMKVNEEVNALTTMALDPVKFLIVPRVIAATLMTPLLAIFGSFAGLVGGAVVMSSLNYPIVTYINRVTAAVGVWDFTSGMIKAVTFGLLIAGVGCIRGLQTKSGASAVGASTTSAVVSSIVIIAVVDGIYSVVFYYLETWGS